MNVTSAHLAAHAPRLDLGPPLRDPCRLAWLMDGRNDMLRIYSLPVIRPLALFSRLHWRRPTPSRLAQSPCVRNDKARAELSLFLNLILAASILRLSFDQAPLTTIGRPGQSPLGLSSVWEWVDGRSPDFSFDGSIKLIS